MSNPFDFTFDATQVAPDQGAGVHPVGKFPAIIKNTEIKPNKDNTGGYLEVTYDTPSGTAFDRFNKWHPNPDTVRIADAQLSALCHATGVFRLTGASQCAELRNARLMIEVANQIDKQTKQPTGYTQVVTRYDANGNLPGKSGAAPAPAAQGFGAGTAAPIAAAPAPQGAPAGWPQGATAAPAAPAWPGAGPAPAPAGGPQWAQPGGPAPAPQGQPAPGGFAPQGQPQAQPQGQPGQWQNAPGTMGAPASAGPAPAWGQR